MTVPPEIRDTPIGADESLVTDTPSDHIDVRDHGAELDGSTDDREAIQDALDEAAQDGTPDTVLIPEGTALAESAILLRERHSGVTLKGTGPDSCIQMAADRDGNHQLISVDPRRGGPITDLTFRDFRIDGQGDTQTDKQGWGILTWSSENGDQVLIENIWAHDFSGSNFQIHTADTVLRHISSWGAVHYHGIGLGCDIDDPDRPVAVEYAHCRENQIHGIDAATGHTVIKHILSEDNGWGGKNSEAAYTGVWEDVVFRNNEKCGYMSIDGTLDKVTMRRVMARDNGWTGLRFVGDMTFELEDLVLLGNDTKDARHGNIYIGGPVACEATRILTGTPANGDGVMMRSHSNGRPRGEISEVVHDGVSIDNESDITIEKTIDGTVDPLPLPTNPNVDGGSGDGDTGGGDDGGASEPTSDLPHLLVIDGSDVGDSLNYEFSVTGEIEKSTEAGASINDVDQINGADVSGWVTRTVDAYRYSGEIVNLAASQSDDVDQLSLSVDGEVVTIEDLSDGPTETDDGDTGGDETGDDESGGTDDPDESGGSDGSDESDDSGDSGGETGDGDDESGGDGESGTTETHTLTVELEYEGELSISVNSTDISSSDT